MSHRGTALVLTHAFDPSADRVVEELNRRGTPVFRCDPGRDFPTRLELDAHLDHADHTDTSCGRASTGCTP